MAVARCQERSARQDSGLVGYHNGFPGTLHIGCMWPWGHLAIGYLLYSPTYRVRTGRQPAAIPVVFLSIGTQFPDLVDKPLAYWFAFLPTGRSLAHSYLVAIPVCAFILLAARYFHHREAGIAFAVGYLSHPVADGVTAIIRGQWSAITYMAWPVLPSPDYEATSFAYHLTDLLVALRELSPGMLLHPASNLFVLELWLTVLLIIVWGSDGLPPLRQIVGRVRSKEAGAFLEEKLS